MLRDEQYRFPRSPPRSVAAGPPSLPAGFKRSFSASSASPSPFTVGLKELRDVFDMDDPIVIIDEESGIEPVHPSLSRQHSSDDASVASSSSSAKVDASNQQDMPLPSMWPVRSGLAACSLAWGAICIWALTQDPDELSPFVLLPATVPFFTYVTALAVVVFKTRAELQDRCGLLGQLSRVMRASILVQGLFAALVWVSMGGTATYAHGTQLTHSRPGSWYNFMEFTCVALAQAILPVAAFLWIQWQLAMSFRGLARSSQGRPSARVLESLSLRESPVPDGENLKVVSVQETSVPAANQDRATRPPPFRPTHRSRRPSSPSSHHHHHHHHRSLSQPAPIPFEREKLDVGLSPDGKFAAEPLLVRGVQQGFVQPRRSRTYEADAAGYNRRPNVAY